MFERFTNRARRVVVWADLEARELKHSYIGTEHILLGLIDEDEGVAAKALHSLCISLSDVRDEIRNFIGEGLEAPDGHIPFTPRAKKVLELSLREALQLGHNYIGTEHILLGLIREGEGVASITLVKLGAELTRVRERVIQVLSGTDPESVREAQQEHFDVLVASLKALPLEEQLTVVGDQIENSRKLMEGWVALRDTIASRAAREQAG